MTTVKVIRFNWPKYAGVLAIVLAAAASTVLGAPLPVRAALWLACLPGVGWTASSLVATYWVYDHRSVYRRLTTGLGDLGEWAAVHAGFDDSVPALISSIGRSPVAVTEVAGPSLRRARALTRGTVSAAALAAVSADSIFVTFAAHEVRGLAAQQDLFGQLRGALRPGGRLVITEHARDLANFAVYGPGAMHFQPLATWSAWAAEAGLSVESDTSITPFVHRGRDRPVALPHRGVDVGPAGTALTNPRRRARAYAVKCHLTCGNVIATLGNRELSGARMSRHRLAWAAVAAQRYRQAWATLEAGRHRLAWAAAAAVASAGIAGAVTGAMTTGTPAASDMAATRSSAMLETAAARPIQAQFFGPSMVWRLTKTADRTVVESGQRIAYTIILQQLQPPLSVAERMCLGRPDQADCVTANTILLSEPLVLDDLSGVTAHTDFDNDAKGVPGTIVRVQTRAGNLMITAEPDTALPSVTRLRFTFSVRVRHHTKPGTSIANTAYVSVHTAYAPVPGPLTNCPLEAVFTHGTVPSACTAVSAIPPARGGAQTGFGGMAGHVGNLGRH